MPLPHERSGKRIGDDRPDLDLIRCTFRFAAATPKKAAGVNVLTWAMQPFTTSVHVAVLRPSGHVAVLSPGRPAEVLSRLDDVGQIVRVQRQPHGAYPQFIVLSGDHPYDESDALASSESQDCCYGSLE